MLEKPSGPAQDRVNETQILFLTLAEVDDRSFGGAIRSNDMRSSLQQAGDVDTLVIHGASRFAIDERWDERRVKRATFSRDGLSPAALDQRRQIRSWVARTLSAKHYDVIVARYLGLALFVRLRHWRKLVLDADDIFKTPPAAVSTSRAARLKFGLRNAAAIALLHLARHVWVVNPRDSARLPTRRTSQLPNAVSLSVLNPVCDAPVSGRILMVGYFEHPPNAEGLEWFANRILSRLVERFPGVELHAIGKISPHLARRFSAPVVIHGFVDDLAVEYARATIVIAPIRSGGGTQIKVLEALAHERLLISSTFAHTGFAEHLVNGEHLVTADSEEEWLTACQWALRNPGSCRHLAAAGRIAVHRNYGTGHMAAAIQRTINEIVG